MKSTKKNSRKLSRRGVLPILGSGLLLPLLGFGKSNSKNTLSSIENEEFQTLLKPDGTTVKVKVNTLKNAKVIKKDVSNKSLLNWLGRKL